MWPLKRLHTPTVLLWGLALPEASVHHHTHCAPSCSTRVVRNGRGSDGGGNLFEETPSPRKPTVFLRRDAAPTAAPRPSLQNSTTYRKNIA